MIYKEFIGFGAYENRCGHGIKIYIILCVIYVFYLCRSNLDIMGTPFGITIINHRTET